MTGRFAATALVALLLVTPLARGEAVARVDVVQEGDTYIVDTVMVAPVPLSDAWAVLTDFDGMAHFVPNLTESRVIGRGENRMTVQQKGVARFGPLRFAFESVRELELNRNESVLSRQISGAMRMARSQTRFFDAGGATRITYHAELEPGTWLPGFISRGFIAHEVREQFEAIAREMVRRRSTAAAARPLEATQ